MCVSRTTWVSWYQKGNTNLDFTEARDSEWQWYQLGCMQVCTSLQTDNHASTPPLSFLHAGCPSCHPTNRVKALKAVQWRQWRLYQIHLHYYFFAMASVCPSVMWVATLQDLSHVSRVASEAAAATQQASHWDHCAILPCQRQLLIYIPHKHRASNALCMLVKRKKKTFQVPAKTVKGTWRISRVVW